MNETYHVGIFLWIGDADVCEFNVQILKDQSRRDVRSENENDETIQSNKFKKTKTKNE